MKISILNGPNLNKLGTRNPEIYGTQSLADIEALCAKRCQHHGLEMDFFQSNHEGALIDKIHSLQNCDGLIINPAAYSHTSIALHDALEPIHIPIIEVHLSNIHARETFRHHSYVSRAATGVIVGLGVHGYTLAIDALADLVSIS